MTLFIVILCLVLLITVVIQIGKITELAGEIRGEKDVEYTSNYWNSRLGMIFMVGFLVLSCITAYYYKNYMLGYGPHTSASANGVSQDQLFDVTLVITGIVFILTHIALFWYAYKYRGRPGLKAVFMPHDNKLEIIWTAIPAVAMTILVAFGLNVWNNVMADVGADEEFIEIEATGMQFAWVIRYTGADGKLGERYYRDINGLNPLGQVWEDRANIDDFLPTEIVLPVNKKVRVKITSRDVQHNFDLPHFRVKMDAVPGMPTYFVFTPTTTTAEYRKRLKNYPEYNIPADPEEPDGPKKWETFDYELACAELCGKGHFSMRYIVRIVSEEEYAAWLETQSSYYMTTIRNTDADPFVGELLNFEIEERAIEFTSQMDLAMESEDTADDILVLRHLFYETGSAKLSENSKFELQNVIGALKKYPTMKIELAGHTDSTGSADLNQELSESRAMAARNYLISKGIDEDRVGSNGYGQLEPIGDNDTQEGRQKNRRTELRIISK